MNRFRGTYSPLLARPKATLQHKKCKVRVDCYTFRTASSDQWPSVRGLKQSTPMWMYRGRDRSHRWSSPIMGPSWLAQLSCG